jgi:rRNA maturation RNase YbeY
MPAHSFHPDSIGAPTIDFASVEIEFALENTAKTKAWLKNIIEQEECQLHSLNFIFCSDEYLHQLNVDYLNHDTLTDVITFPYAEPPSISGDVFISIERVKDNAKQFAVPFSNELNRVMVHGVLHLCGYGDKTETEAKLMRKKEDDALTLLSKI